jgi:hypothetical protein
MFYLYIPQLITSTFSDSARIQSSNKMNVQELKKKYTAVAASKYPEKPTAHHSALGRYMTAVYMLDKSDDANVIRRAKAMIKSTAKTYETQYPFMKAFVVQSKNKSNPAAIKAFALDAIGPEGFTLEDIVKIAEPAPPSTPDIAEGKVAESVEKIEKKPESKGKDETRPKKGDETRPKREDETRPKKGEPVTLTDEPDSPPDIERMRRRVDPTDTAPTFKDLRTQVMLARARAKAAEEQLKRQEEEGAAQRAQLEMRLRALEKRERDQQMSKAGTTPEDTVEMTDETITQLAPAPAPAPAPGTDTAYTRHLLRAASKRITCTPDKHRPRDKRWASTAHRGPARAHKARC